MSTGPGPDPLPLDDEQKRIAGQLQGGLLVLAPVGTGKTAVLTERVARAIEQGIDPTRILCLTFTNRAAQEMEQRLQQRFGDRAQLLNLRTFHRLCAEILRLEAKGAGLPIDFTISDEDDSVELLHRISRGIRPLDAKGAGRLFHRLERLKSSSYLDRLSWPLDFARVYDGLRADDRPIAERYQTELTLRQMLDFGDLVLLVRALFAGQPEVRERWAARFDFVQVDEVQDTHESEYEVVKVLAERTGHLALIGDVDQTIYEWRGARPDGVLARFRRDFGVSEPLTLRWNYRATRRLIQAASSFAGSFERRRTRVEPAPDRPEGEPILLYVARDVGDEARWIGQRIHELVRARPGFAYQRVGVLAPTNRRRERISAGLEQVGVPHLSFHQVEFFRRPEVKDLLAYLRLLLNPNDTGAMLRAVPPLLGGDERALVRIWRDGLATGLRLVDLLRADTFRAGDPFGRLLDAYDQGTVTVFDVETTGLAESQDEIVEVAARRLECGRPAGDFHAFLRNSVPVGHSIAIHRLSDAFLAKYGRPPTEALADFLEFCRDDLLVGHNVAFDERIVQSYARRLGLSPPPIATADTYQLALRFVPADLYTLAALAERLGLPHRPVHRALADVEATCDLLAHLVERAREHAAERRALLEREGQAFASIAERFEAWAALARMLRPAELADRLLVETGLAERYAGEPRQRRSLEELVRALADRDDPRLEPLAALREAVARAALTGYLDQIDRVDRVPVITIHQAKGLQFDVVFVVGLSEGTLPRWRSVEDGRLEEERRLFYVALTRAREQLFLTATRQSDEGFTVPLSQFLQHIDPDLLRRV